jgi:hypothetical protein
MFALLAGMMMFFHHDVSNCPMACLLWVGLAVAGTACQTDECPGGAVRCVGKVAQSCVPRGSDDPALAWYSNDCGEGFCHLSTDPTDPAPFCAATAEPDPSCPQEGSEHCDGNQVIMCRQGYVVFTKNCTTGDHTGDNIYAGHESNGYCVSVGDAAECAMEPSPNPLCSGRYFNQDVCDGNRVLSCGLGYAIDAYDCPTTRTCVPGEYAFCALSATLVPGCPLDEINYNTCKDGAIVTCRYGYMDLQEACPAGQTCSASSYGTSYCQQG